MVARYTSTPPVIDGVFSPEEWAGALPVYVAGSLHPATAPGVVPKIPGLPYLFAPDSPQDSSFTIYTLYDANNLYVAVDVLDQIIICDGPVPYLDDDAEIFIDGDCQPGDLEMATVCGQSKYGQWVHRVPSVRNSTKMYWYQDFFLLFPFSRFPSK